MQAAQVTQVTQVASSYAIGQSLGLHAAMGGATCRPCCEDGNDSNQMVTVETMTSVADAIKLEQHDKSRLTSTGFLGGVLQGRWRRMDDKSLLGRIHANKMIWQPLYQHPPTTLRPAGEDRIYMDLEGSRHEGIVVFSASSSKLLINWSDGEIWTKDP
ncbi:unnamed protein product [Effrenium voratum]|uniref:Uncharacterized protein n=1 Tax=Effrenium voratum TaxID=2562239 RepID=A0AA36HVR7_9DINO|nr:unnamed protein product [Effrenium voratum]CAJ1375547.1 unnamed protein product [Effrenium voratum]CAJ1447929.1 unnamed protein product [Effrenium voratum]